MAGEAGQVTDGSVNDSDYEGRADATAHEPDAQEPGGGQLPAAPRPGLEDLAPPAADRIQRFMAESTVRGGASPADVADLYTSQEIMDDDEATAYLDRRFVHGEVLGDWRELQDRLSAAYLHRQADLSAEALLALVRREAERQLAGRSIFDDPDDDEWTDDDVTARLEDRDPGLADLSEDARRAVERYIISEVLNYGVAPFKVMELREGLRAEGNERALQYLDLPFELGDRPIDWERLRDRALMIRARLERLGIDPSAAYSQADASHPDADGAELLSRIDDQEPRR